MNAYFLEVMLTENRYSDYNIKGLLLVESREWVDAQWDLFLAAPHTRDFKHWLVDAGAQECNQLECNIDTSGGKHHWSKRWSDSSGATI